MRPEYRILADTRDITMAVADRLIDLKITDEAGMQSDTLEIRLDDRTPVIELPRTGAELDVAIGYRESGLVSMGLYVVDELGLDGPPAALTIRARAADMRQSLKAPKSRSWDQITLADLVTTLAAEHGYLPKIAAELGCVVLAHVDQTEESDLHLLTRLASQYGAIAKPAMGNLVLALRGKAKSMSGRDLPVLQIAGKDISRWRMTAAERGKYQSVVAHWHDIDTAQRIPVLAGAGEPRYTLRNDYPDETAALHAAAAKLTAFSRGTATVSLTLPGDPRLGAEAKIVISDLRPGVDGEWLTTRVTHSISRNGYSCDVEGESPK